MDKGITTREDLQRPWDTCREVPVIEDEHTPWKMLKLLKIISLIIVAISVFGLALCSKTSFLLLITLSHEGSKTLLPEQKPVALLGIGCSLVAPSVLVLLKSIWKACYKTSKLPRKSTTALVLFFEFIVSVGVSVLTIVAMPHFDIVTNVTILNGVAVISALLQAVAQCTSKETSGFSVPSIMAFIFLCVGYSLFFSLYIMKDLTDVKMAIWVGLAVGGSILASFNWWENYFMLICVKKKSGFLSDLFEDLTKSQNVLHILSSLLRIAVTACVLGAYVPLVKMDWVGVTFIPRRETIVIGIIIGVQLISSALCHWFALAACKMHVVRRCFILPLYLASLAVMALLIVPVVVSYEDYKLNLNTKDGTNFRHYCFGAMDGRNQTISDDLFLKLVFDVTQTLCVLDLSNVTDISLLIGAAASWWIGLLLATVYIWFLKVDRIQKTQDLFVRRLYEGAFIEQSLLLNTRFNVPTKNRNKTFGGNAVPAMVYLCATMWHETQDEMMNIMISIFRLDKYRPNDSKNDLKFDDFNFEAHIYFDDAFENINGSQERHLNSYAGTLVKIITEVYGVFKNLDKSFFGMQQHIPEQKIIKTPYGARLFVTMPHGNNIVVHFKDKQLIRNKKRWSQVMYLYYLLGWKLMSKHYSKWKVEGRDEKDVRAEIQREKHNTYILALDGDTDFQPASVMLLIDRLKMYPGVGAACGRIHPTGSGPAVWFQKFEYAVCHWLQKTAEHVFGCVLCSPGCFSLFRAEALMDDNVMKRYSTKSTEARHYIQYDQGEDRWLCTLMLKQGWRVEYNAASDAYTNAPQDFKELYNQRKRWGPSTMANVVDLLASTNIVSKKNPSMSKPFMFYQLFATISAILAPATVCLMVASSLTFLLNMSSSWALVLAVIPPVIFLGLCFKLKADTQITIAAVFSIMYAFLMLAVTISVIASMVKDQTILTPSSLFVVIMSIIYIVTALMHPQELPLVFYGLLYILCIPSAYLLLTIYSMVNMNSVSWGTRETKPAAEAVSAASSPLTRSQKATNTFQQLFSWMKCCKNCHQRPEDAETGVRHENLIPESMQPQNTVVDDISLEGQEQMETVFDSPVECWKRQLQDLSSSIKMEEDRLEGNEETFWNELIKKYLEPLQTNKEEQEKTRDDLRDLRNKVNFSFFFLNALWLVAVFILQIFSVTVIEVDMVDLNLNKTGKKFTIEPLGLMFILGFSLSVFFQLVGMLVHRINTLMHYIAFLETEPKQQKAAEKKIASLQGNPVSTKKSSSDLSTYTNSSFISEDPEAIYEDLDNKDKEEKRRYSRVLE